MIAEMMVNADVMEKAAGQGYATATDLADWLVKELALPFRQAHQVTAQIVRIAESRNIMLEDMPLGDMQKIEPRITSTAIDILSVRQSIESRTSLGGTAPARVKEAINDAKQRLAET